MRAAAPEWIPAAVLFRELKALGYDGGLTRLKLHLMKLKPAMANAPLIRIETEPGRQLHVDFDSIRRGPERLSVFIATLGWSRAACMEFVDDERLETLLGCHERAFYCFGCVPRDVLYDNMHAVVTARDAYGAGRHRYNRTFLDFAHHYGFRPRLCQPYRPRTKGKVDRFIRYLRASFYLPLGSQLSPEGLPVDRDTANARVGTWLREVANARRHATIGEIPAVRLLQERERLQPLPPPRRGELEPMRRARAVEAATPTGYQHPLRIYEELLARSGHERAARTPGRALPRAPAKRYRRVVLGAGPAGRRTTVSIQRFHRGPLVAERESRRTRALEMFAQVAGFPAIKTLDQYDFPLASGAPRKQIMELASWAFIERGENLVLLGRRVLARPTSPSRSATSPPRRATRPDFSARRTWH